MWHASVAKLNQSYRPVECRSVVNKGFAYALGTRLLNGVGVGQIYLKTGESAFHIRRSLSAEEIAGLSPEWLAIPAVDIAG